MGVLASALLLSAAVAACTESFTGGEACPTLCPSKPLAFRDTTIDAVILDTALSGYPSLGLSDALLLANRPDTLVTRAVLRFDALATVYQPNKGSSSENISAVDSAFLVLPLDTTGTRGSATFTVEAFDVDTALSDSSTTVVKSLFRTDRRLGSRVVTLATLGDSLRIPLDRSVLATKIAAAARLRVGLRIVGGTGQLRLRAFYSGTGVPMVRYDPSTDTTYAPLTVTPSTTMEYATSELIQAYTVYGIVDKGSPAPEANTLIVGGFPAYRTYMRFNVPAFITDSSTIVRAEVLITQRPSRFANVTDTVSILPMVPAAVATVTDFRRIIDLSADGIFAALDSARVVPRDSGQRVINILSMARGWKNQPTTVPRAVAFRIGMEGAQPAEVRFFSSKAPVALRPRLRLTFQPKTESALP